MRRLAIVALIVVLVGCTRPIETAILASNSAREVLVEAKAVLTAACQPAYEAAQGAEAVAAVDARCVPAGRAYDALRAAWVAAVAAVGAAQAGRDGDLAVAVAELGQALERMRAALRGLPARRPRARRLGEAPGEP